MLRKNSKALPCTLLVPDLMTYVDDAARGTSVFGGVVIGVRIFELGHSIGVGVDHDGCCPGKSACCQPRRGKNVIDSERLPAHREWVAGTVVLIGSKDSRLATVPQLQRVALDQWKREDALRGFDSLPRVAVTVSTCVTSPFTSILHWLVAPTCNATSSRRILD